MKLGLLPIQVALIILWYVWPAMAAVPAWVVFLPTLVLLGLLALVILAKVIEVSVK